MKYGKMEFNMCDQCNELAKKLLSESILRGIYEGKAGVLEKQVQSQQITINTLLNIINGTVNGNE